VEGRALSFSLFFFANSRGPDNSNPKKFGLNVTLHFLDQLSCLKEICCIPKGVFPVYDMNISKVEGPFCFKQFKNPNAKLDSSTKQILKKIWNMTQVLSTI